MRAVYVESMATCAESGAPSSATDSAAAMRWCLMTSLAVEYGSSKLPARLRPASERALSGHCRHAGHRGQACDHRVLPGDDEPERVDLFLQHRGVLLQLADRI